MLDKFWGSIGSTVSERLLEYIFGPAFLFWAGGIGLYVWATNWQQVLNNIQSLNQFQQGSWIILTLLALAFSSALIQAIRFPVLRLLEGYWPWPLNYLCTAIIALRRPSFQKKNAELRRLATVAVEDQSKLTTVQRERLSELDSWAHWHPVNSKDLLPTALGNILRAREYTPERKYGLDAIICWPRFWPLLPENMRTNLAHARSALDRLVELWIWGFLFLLWTVWTPWAMVVSLLWMAATYSMANQAAMAYGELLESAFDLYRFSLYDAMGWSRPRNSEEEKMIGAQLTEYLWRGTSQRPIKYKGNKRDTIKDL